MSGEVASDKAEAVNPAEVGSSSETAFGEVIDAHADRSRANRHTGNNFIRWLSGNYCEPV